MMFGSIRDGIRFGEKQKKRNESFYPVSSKQTALRHKPQGCLLGVM